MLSLTYTLKYVTMILIIPKTLKIGNQIISKCSSRGARLSQTLTCMLYVVICIKVAPRAVYRRKRNGQKSNGMDKGELMWHCDNRGQ